MRQLGMYSIVLAIGLAVGYWLMPKKEVVKTVEKQVDRVVTIVKRPDGTVEKVITDKSKISSNETTTVKDSPKYSVSALVGTNFKEPYYGAHASKELLGPVTVGGFGLVSQSLTNVLVGASIGLNF